MTKPAIAIASDHAGIQLKQLLSEYLITAGYKVVDYGTNSTDSVDYPDYADKIADALEKGIATEGVLICGTGIGISIAANRYSHIRAALCHNAETAKLAREHNDANVLVLGARILDDATALACLKAFLATPFEGGRHMKRVAKLSRERLDNKS